jgi:hypothetical protein
MEGPIAIMERTSPENGRGEARDPLEVCVSTTPAGKWVFRAGNLWDHGSCTNAEFWQQVFFWQLWGGLWNRIFLGS